MVCPIISNLECTCIVWMSCWYLQRRYTTKKSYQRRRFSIIIQHHHVHYHTSVTWNLSHKEIDQVNPLTSFTLISSMHYFHEYYNSTKYYDLDYHLTYIWYLIPPLEFSTWSFFNFTTQPINNSWTESTPALKNSAAIPNTLLLINIYWYTTL